MNRRSFITSLGFAAAVVALPAVAVADAPTPAPPVPAPAVEASPFFSLSQLADGFAEVEEHEVIVSEVRINPADVERFLDAFRDHYDQDCIRLRLRNPKIVSYLWGATVMTDASIPRSRAKVLSEELEATEHCPVVRQAIAWV